MKAAGGNKPLDVAGHVPQGRKAILFRSEMLGGLTDTHGLAVEPKTLGRPTAVIRESAAAAVRRLGAAIARPLRAGLNDCGHCPNSAKASARSHRRANCWFRSSGTLFPVAAMAISFCGRRCARTWTACASVNASGEPASELRSPWMTRTFRRTVGSASGVARDVAYSPSTNKGTRRSRTAPPVNASSCPIARASSSSRTATPGTVINACSTSAAKPFCQ